MSTKWGFLLPLLVVFYTQAVAQTHSLNAVGVLRVDVLAGEPKLTAAQLVPQGAEGNRFTVGQTFGTNAIPDGTRMKIFIPGAEVYVEETFSEGAWTPGTNLLVRGQGFWIVSPVEWTFRMVGYVPDATDAATTTVAVAEGLQLMASPYPAAGTFGSAMDTNVLEGDVVARLGADGRPDAASPSATYFGGAWHPAEGVLEVSEAWWHVSHSNKTWNIVKPYEYP